MLMSAMNVGEVVVPALLFVTVTLTKVWVSFVQKIGREFRYLWRKVKEYFPFNFLLLRQWKRKKETEEGENTGEVKQGIKGNQKTLWPRSQMSEEQILRLDELIELFWSKDPAGYENSRRGIACRPCVVAINQNRRNVTLQQLLRSCAFIFVFRDLHYRSKTPNAPK